MGRTIPILFFGLAMVLTANPPSVVAGQGFSVTAPERAGTDGPVHILVRFPSPPTDNDFYRIEIRIDGVAAELADVSRTDRTTVELPPLKPGSHKVTVLWRNPPDKHAVRETRTVTIEKKP